MNQTKGRKHKMKHANIISRSTQTSVEEEEAKIGKRRKKEIDAETKEQEREKMRT